MTSELFKKLVGSDSKKVSSKVQIKDQEVLVIRNGVVIGKCTL